MSSSRGAGFAYAGIGFGLCLCRNSLARLLVQDFAVCCVLEGELVSEARSLLGRWEPTAISDYLEERCKILYDDGEERDSMDYVVLDVGTGPITKLVSTVLFPCPLGLLAKQRMDEACEW